MAWRCPDCGRSFGRRNQPHSCVPAAGLEDWLSKRKPAVSGILAAVRASLDGLGGDVLVESTRDAVMIKRSRTFAELKPRRDHAELAFIVSRRIEDPRIVRTLDLTRTRIVHVIAIPDATGVDEQVRAWLSEAYEQSPT